MNNEQSLTLPGHVKVDYEGVSCGRDSADSIRVPCFTLTCNSGPNGCVFAQQGPFMHWLRTTFPGTDFGWNGHKKSPCQAHIMEGSSYPDRSAHGKAIKGGAPPNEPCTGKLDLWARQVPNERFQQEVSVEYLEDKAGEHTVFSRRTHDNVTAEVAQ